jgi:addiction module RelE/StbE family toxin
MVNITRGKKFTAHFKKRIHPHKELVRLYQEQIKLFIEDRNDPALNDHALSGKLQGSRAFNITEDIRVIYLERGEKSFIFLNVGTHKQVYGK